MRHEAEINVFQEKDINNTHRAWFSLGNMTLGTDHPVDSAYLPRRPHSNDYKVGRIYTVISAVTWQLDFETDII